MVYAPDHFPKYSVKHNTPSCSVIQIIRQSKTRKLYLDVEIPIKCYIMSSIVIDDRIASKNSCKPYDLHHFAPSKMIHFVINRFYSDRGILILGVFLINL